MTLVPSPVRERGRVRDAPSPENPDPSSQPPPAQERGRVPAYVIRGVSSASLVGALESAT
ncbi:hypothetical protein FV228_08795 [Methylobacterium sp. WL18]|nr:hypothetical protein FV228_08795 [Methylobacterium sp. WL18]